MTAPVPGDPTDIGGVLAALRTVVDEAAGTGSRIGYFAALYRQVTLAVAQAIADGVFDDGARLSRLDAAFGNRYLHALHACQATPDGAAAPECWRLAFAAAGAPGPVLVQHLVLGVNAHINLDLAVAAAQTCPGTRSAISRTTSIGSTRSSPRSWRACRASSTATRRWSAAWT